jgi:hypothetical protein
MQIQQQEIKYKIIKKCAKNYNEIAMNTVTINGWHENSYLHHKQK